MRAALRGGSFFIAAHIENLHFFNDFAIIKGDVRLYLTFFKAAIGGFYSFPELK